MSEPRQCPQSRRKDGKHSWLWDGDDPYVVCSFCGDRKNALTGEPVGPPAVPVPASEPANEQDVAALAGSIAAVLNRASLGLARFSDYEQAVADLNALAALAAARGDAA